MDKHRLIVSAENNPYLAWQCKLFYFSCVSRLKRQPIVIVHETSDDWAPGFYELAKAGCAVYCAPNYRTFGGGDNLPGRNHAGSMIKAAEVCSEQAEFIVLCDPDLIFVTPIDFLDRLSAEYSSFMDYDLPYVEEARLQFGIQRQELDEQKARLTVAVPYVVPTTIAAEFGHTWLQAIDAFPRREANPENASTSNNPTPKRRHVVMYGFGLAVLKLGLDVEVTHFVDHNFWPYEPARAPIIHYAYGDERWTKRAYFTEEQARAVWHPKAKAAEGTILNEILAQLEQAGEFYRDPYFPS